MEILITCSVGIVLHNNQHYMQVITAKYEHHYFAPISHTQAINMAAADEIEIGEAEELNGTVFNPAASMILPDGLLIPDDRREDMLVGAIEGGSNYWYWLGDEATALVDKHGNPKKEPFSILMWKAIQAGESIPVHDKEEMADDDDTTEENRLGYINLESIKKGERIMLEKYNKHYMDIINEGDDAITADIWFQLAVMGEVTFG